MTLAALSRHPALQRFVEDHVRLRAELGEPNLFELLWGMSGCGFPKAEAEARSLTVLELSDRFGELAQDPEVSPADLEETFAGDVASGSRLVVARHARALIGLLADFASDLALAAVATNPRATELSWSAGDGWTTNDAPSILGRIHAATASLEDPQRDAIMTALLAWRAAPELERPPWTRAGEPVWSEENRAAFAAAVTESAFAAYLHGPRRSGHGFRIAESVWAALDTTFATKLIEALHFARFSGPNRALTVAEEAGVRDEYVSAIRRPIAQRALEDYRLRNLGDLGAPWKRDAVEFAVRVLASESPRPSRKEQLHRVHELLLPFEATDEIAQRVLHDGHRRRTKKGN